MVDQDIRWLDIPMHDTGGVHKVDGAKNIINQVDYVFRRKWLHLIRYLVEYFSEIALHVLHNHEQVRKLER